MNEPSVFEHIVTYFVVGLICAGIWTWVFVRRSLRRKLTPNHRLQWFVWLVAVLGLVPGLIIGTYIGAMIAGGATQPVFGHWNHILLQVVFSLVLGACGALVAWGFARLALVVVARVRSAAQ
jgi:hypothetical protein